MELMSMLLLCAFVAKFPVSLGAYGIPNSGMKLNSSNFIGNSAFDSNRSHRIIDFKILPLADVNTNAELQALLGSRCKNCVSCVEEAFKTQKNCTHGNDRHSKDFFYDIFQENFQNKRYKRSIRSNPNNTGSDLKMEESKPNGIIITKYKAVDGKVYAIKVNETIDQILGLNDAKSTCKVYSVKKAFACESNESNLILNKQKVKSNKKSRISKDKTATTEKAIPVTAVFKKRKVRVESSNMPESFMPSLEDLY